MKGIGRTVWILWALAALTRLLFLFSFTDKAFPFSVFYYGDSRLYREFALSILRGDLYDQGIPFHPPGFAYLLAGIIQIVGERPLAMRAILALVASSSVPLTYLLGRRLWGERAALVGALLSTFSFGLLVFAVAPNAETIYLPLLLTQALLVVYIGDAWDAGLRRRSWILAAASGVVLGAGSLTRAEHLAFGLIVPLALGLRRPKLALRTLAGMTGVLVGTAALVLAPWTLHNLRAISHFNAAQPASSRPLPIFVLVSSYGPLNFALANHAGADGTFRPEAASAAAGRGTLDLRQPEHVDLYLDGYRRGLAFLRDRPLEAGALWLKKLDLALGALALGFGSADFPSGLSGIRRPVDLFVPERRGWAVLILALAAWGAYQTRSILRKTAVVWLILLHKLAVVVAFFGYARLLGHVLPFVFLLIGAAVAGLLRTPRLRKSAWVAGAVAAIVLTCQLALSCATPRSLSATGSIDAATGKIVQDAELRLAPAPRRP